MLQPDYRVIVEHLERCFLLHGDTHKGMDWPNARDAALRYDVMLGVIREPRPANVRLLDFGCGAGHLYQYIQTQAISGIAYSGLDISELMIGACRSKWPEIDFVCGDVLAQDIPIPEADYIVMNGVFTEKREVTWEAMFNYMRQLVPKVFRSARIGLAFNVMSNHVDWERDDLFHLPIEVLTTFITSSLSRHFLIRHDYGLYEYTAYVFRRPNLPENGDPSCPE
jgi:SAM-dependent methyltransferase